MAELFAPVKSVRNRCSLDVVFVTLDMVLQCTYAPYELVSILDENNILAALRWHGGSG